MKLSVQLIENKNNSDKNEICVTSNFLYAHTMYSCIIGFGVFFISSKHIPSLNSDLFSCCNSSFLSLSQTVFERNCQSEDCAADLKLQGKLLLSR